MGLDTSGKMWRGPLIGMTATGYKTPVFWDPNTQINVLNKGGGIMVSGGSGHGKTFFALTMAMLAATAGKTVMYYDPKNDARRLGMLQDELDGHITQFDMSSQAQNGELDPWNTNLERAYKTSKIIALLDTLFGTNLTPNQNTKLYAVVNDVSNMKEPSLTRLMAELQRSPDPEVSELGTRLNKIQASNPQVSGTLFRKLNGDKPKEVTLGDGLTIITAESLDLPEQDQDTFSDQDRLALAVMYLIVDQIVTAMNDEKTQNNPKLIIIDEAWAIAKTKLGKQLIAKLVRLGRSYNTATILLTQSVDDLDDVKGINNFIGTRFAFGIEDEEIEGPKVCKKLGIDSSYSKFLKGLGSGVCFIKDASDRVSLINILSQSERWAEAFETNPAKRAANLARQAAGL